MDVNIEKEDWEILAGMGSGAEEGLQAAGIDDFDEAVEACAVLQGADAAASGAEYKLDDLICFLCLSQHKEAVSDPAVMMSFPHPVSIEEDLGLDPLSPPRALQECPAAFPALGDSAVQPLKKARRWRTNTLLQPLAQLTTSRHGFTTFFASTSTSIENHFLSWLPIASAICFVQCDRSLHGGGIPIAGRLDDGQQRVADSVSDIMFHPRQYIPLMKLGVSGSTLLRTVARAWEWLQQCPPVFVDESLLPLVLLRMGIKFEGGTRHMEAALQLLEPLDEEQALLSLESRLVEALWRGPGDLPLPLPMAR
jgi:hypothetical protein